MLFLNNYLKFPFSLLKPFMNKIFFIFLLISFQIKSQTSNSDSTKTKLKPYVSAGVSIGNVNQSNSNSDNFSKSSYPSLEVGIMGKNLSLGAIIGAENFLVTSTTRPFYELKTSISKSFGKISPYALFGAGAYFENSFNPFIEYGAGFSFMPNKLGYFVQYSNWANTNYVSVGFTYVF